VHRLHNTLINCEKAQKPPKIGISERKVLAVKRVFMYAMHWRKNVTDALAARNLA